MPARVTQQHDLEVRMHRVWQIAKGVVVAWSTEYERRRIAEKARISKLQTEDLIHIMAGDALCHAMSFGLSDLGNPLGIGQTKSIILEILREREQGFVS